MNLRTMKVSPKNIFLTAILFPLLAAAQVTLTVNISGSGSVVLDPLPDQNGFYATNTTVMMIAKPSEQWKFKAWSGDVVSTNDTATVSMDANKVVTATFAKNKLLFVVDESADINRLANRVSTIFSQSEEVLSGGKDIVLDDTTKVVADYAALTGAEKVKIRNKLLELLDQIIAKSDMLKIAIQQP